MEVSPAVKGRKSFDEIFPDISNFQFVSSSSFSSSLLHASGKQTWNCITCYLITTFPDFLPTCLDVPLVQLIFRMKLWQDPCERSDG